MKYAALLHALLSLAVLAACLGWQRQGGAVLLVPLWAQSGVGAAIGGLRGVRLLGPGRPAGSVMVRTTAPLPVAALLRQGIVPISVPSALCGQAT